MERKRQWKRRWRRRLERRAGEASWSLEDGTLVVRGFGRIYSAPDLAIVGLRAEAVNEELAVALRGADDVISAVIERLEALGIAREDLQTSDLRFETSHPEDRLGNVRTDITDYEVTHFLTVMVRDVGLVGRVLGESMAAGAASIDRLTWHAADIAALKAQARDLAMADARAHAEQLAAQVGRRLGQIVALEEEPFTPWGRPWRRSRLGRRDLDDDFDDERDGPPIPQAGVGAPPVIAVEGGRQRVTVRVIVEWATEEAGT